MLEGRMILVLTQGFVLIGDVEQMPDYLFVRLTNASVIRRWGTTEGLGQIALKGATTNTILDPLPDGTLVSRANIHHALPCK